MLKGARLVDVDQVLNHSQVCPRKRPLAPFFVVSRRKGFRSTSCTSLIFGGKSQFSRSEPGEVTIRADKRDERTASASEAERTPACSILRMLGRPGAPHARGSKTRLTTWS